MRALEGKGEQLGDGKMSRIMNTSKMKSSGDEGGFVKLQGDHDGECSLVKVVSNAKQACKQIGDAPAPEKEQRSVSCRLHSETRNIGRTRNGREVSLSEPFRRRFPGFMSHLDWCIRRTELLPANKTGRCWKWMEKSQSGAIGTDPVWNASVVAHPLVIERVGELGQMRSVDQGSTNDSELCAQSIAGIQGELCAEESGLSLISQGNFTGLITTPRHCCFEEIEFGAKAGARQKEAAILNVGRDARASAQALPPLGQHLRQSWSDQGPRGRMWREYHFRSTIPAGRVFQREAARRRMQAGTCPGKRLRERFFERLPLAVSGAIVSAVPVLIPRGIAVLSQQIHVAVCWGWFPLQLPDPQRSSTLQTRMVGARAGHLHRAQEIQAKHFREQLCWAGQLWKRFSQTAIHGFHADENDLLLRRARVAQLSRALEQTPTGLGCPVENPLCRCAGTQEPNGQSGLRFQLEPSRPQSVEFPCVSWPQHSTGKARTIRERCLKR
jgi:hypothetical protein